MNVGMSGWRDRHIPPTTLVIHLMTDTIPHPVTAPRNPQELWHAPSQALAALASLVESRSPRACPLPIHPSIHPLTHAGFPSRLGQLVGGWGLGWGRTRGASEAAGQGAGGGWESPGCLSWGGRWAAWWGAHRDEGGRRVAGPVQLRSPPQQPARVQKGLFVLRL